MEDLQQQVERLGARVLELTNLMQSKEAEYESEIKSLEYELEAVRDDAADWEYNYRNSESDLYDVESELNSVTNAYDEYRNTIEAALRPLLDLARDPAVRYGKPFETVPVKIGDLQDLLDALDAI